MQEHKHTGKTISPAAPEDRKTYQKPELKQLGSVEELTLARKQLSVTVPQ